MAKPDLALLMQDLERFDAEPLSFDSNECKALRKRIYHALYYDDQGWQKLEMTEHIRLARFIPRIHSIEEYWEEEI